VPERATDKGVVHLDLLYVRALAPRDRRLDQRWRLRAEPCDGRCAERRAMRDEERENVSEAFYNENEPYAAQWLENLKREGHIAPGKVDARSIVDIKPKDLEGFRQAHFFAGLGGWSHALRLAGWPDDEEVWTGSCPCQPFSTAGRRKGFADDRHLWPEWFRLIRKCRPRVVFGEQIAGTDGLRWLDLVFADMEGAGYACWATDTCAAGVGAPHLRQRLYFVAYASGERLRRPSVPQSHLEQDSVQSAQRGPGPGQTDGRARVRDVVSGSFGLADSGDQRRNRIDSSVQSGGSHQADPETDGHSTTLELAHPGREGREQVGTNGKGRSSRGGKERVEQRSVYGGHVHELGNAGCERGGRDTRAISGKEEKSDPKRSEARRVPDKPFASGSALELGDASGARPPVGPGPEERFGAVRYEGPSPAETGATRGFWRDAEWWVCRDGKARPAKSEIFPLADGLSARVGKLRAAGNAIVPQQAALFIRAVMPLIGLKPAG